MTGICAVFCDDRELDPGNQVEKMLGRAGGASKHLVDGRVALGAYNSLGDDLNGMVYADESCIVVCDAELYDTPVGSGYGIEAETIARLYKERGKDWTQGVHGVWTAAIYDKQSGNLSSWVDRIGAKTMNWAAGSGLTGFCTRIAPLTLLPGVDTEANNQALYLYLQMEVIPAPYTFYKGVNKLESGHYIETSGQDATVDAYWELRYPVDAGSDEDELGERIRDIMKSQLRNQIEYGPGISSVGSFLSGGTDSSLIAGLTSEMYPEQAKTFSIGFDESGYDEMEFSRFAAKAFGTQHQEYYVNQKDILDTLPMVVSAYDEPYANSSTIPAYICSLMAKDEGLTTILGGDGGDEVFGGNTRYYNHFAHFKRFPSWVPTVLSPVLSVIPSALKRGVIKKADNYVKRSQASLAELVHSFSLSYLYEEKDIFGEGFLAAGPYRSPAEVSQDYIKRSGTEDLLHAYLYHDMKVTLNDNDLRKVGRMTEMAGMRARYPYLDFELVEFSGRFSSKLKVSDGQLRYLFKRAFSGTLPREIIEKKKQGFGLPVVPWMLRKGPLNDLLRDALFDGRLAARGLFKKDFLEKLYNLSEQHPTRTYGRFLYFIFFMELWLREHVDSS